MDQPSRCIIPSCYPLPRLYGVTVDGAPETLTAGIPSWELVTGAQGSLTHVTTFAASFAVTNPVFYYLDDSTPPIMQCTGDAFAYGSSGVWLNQSIPVTDPPGGGTDFLVHTRTLYYDAPGLGVGDAQSHPETDRQP